MPIHKKKDWSIPENKATDESTFLNRRRILAALGIGGAIVAAPFAFNAVKGIMPARAPPATGARSVSRSLPGGTQPRLHAGSPADP